MIIRMHHLLLEMKGKSSGLFKNIKASMDKRINIIAKQASKKITGTQKERVGKILTDGLKAGDTTAELQQKIKDLYTPASFTDSDTR